MSAKSKPQTDTRPEEVRSDEDIARDVRQALKLDNEVPDSRVKVEVRKGIVRLEGNVDTLLEKDAAEFNAKRVKGVHGILNRLQL